MHLDVMKQRASHTGTPVVASSSNAGSGMNPWCMCGRGKRGQAFVFSGLPQPTKPDC